MFKCQLKIVLIFLPFPNEVLYPLLFASPAFSVAFIWKGQKKIVNLEIRVYQEKGKLNFLEQFYQKIFTVWGIIDESGRDRNDVWFGIEKKKKQILKKIDDVCLPFFLLFILWLTGRRFHLSGSQPVSVFAFSHRFPQNQICVELSSVRAFCGAKSQEVCISQTCYKVALQRITLMFSVSRKRKKSTVVHNLLRLLSLKIESFNVVEIYIFLWKT